MVNTKTKVLWLSVSLSLLAVHLIVQVVLDADLIDDAYIFLRYAANMAGGNGLVFNPGEHVEGYSSPLWVLGLGLVAVFPVDLTVMAKVVSALLGAATILLLIMYGRRYLHRERVFLIAIPAWFLVTNTSFQYWIGSGMDTALFTLLFFLTFIVFLRQVDTGGSMGWAGACFLLATLTRLEMLVLAPVYLLFIFYANRRQKQLLAQQYLSFLLPQALLLVHLLWRYSFYGSLLPNTYYAKADIPPATLLNRGLSYSWDFVSAYWLQIVLPTLAVLMLLQARVETVSFERKLALAIIVAWFGCVSIIGGDHFPMFRFYVPILPILALAMTSSLDWLLGQRIKVKKQPKWRLTEYSVVVALLSGIVALNYYAYAFNYEGARMRANVVLTRNWAEVGLWLKHNVSKDATIATVVAGAVPYYSELRTLDLLGLTDKEIATTGHVASDAEIGHQKYDTEYVLAQRPDYIVYNSSGQYTEPIYSDPHKITTRYAYALHHLALDERTGELYEYKALKMENGNFIEFLQLREQYR